MVFAMAEVKLEVNTTPSAQTPTWKAIVDMTTATITGKNTTETWTGLGNDGFQSALKTAIGKEITFDGKRAVGNEGNDYIFSLDDKVGEGAKTQLRLTFPQADDENNILLFPCSVDVTGMGGASTAVGTLSFTATSNGKWSWEKEVAEG